MMASIPNVHVTAEIDLIFMSVPPDALFYGSISRPLDFTHWQNATQARREGNLS
jgi:hypothetical protein